MQKLLFILAISFFSFSVLADTPNGVTKAVKAMEYKECEAVVKDVASWFDNPGANGDYYSQTTDLGGLKDGTLSIFVEVPNGALGHVTFTSSPNGCHVSVIEQHSSNHSCNAYINGAKEDNRSLIQEVGEFKLFQDKNNMNTVQTLRDIGVGCSSFIATTFFVPNEQYKKSI